MVSYLRLIPTVYVVLAAFGALFVLIASLLRAWLGTRYVWTFWAIYFAVVSISCIYKLSGLELGITTSALGHTVYLITVAFVAVGIPLALGAFVLTRNAEHATLHATVRNAGKSWLVIVAMTPAAVALVAAVDYFNLIIVSG